MKPATGSVIVRDGSRGRVYGLRFRANGKRRYITLGHEADGWNAERAEQELEKTLDEVAIDAWTPADAPLNDVIREVLDTCAADEPTELAAIVIERASDDALRAELDAMIASRVRELMHVGRAATDLFNSRWSVPGVGYKRLRDFTRDDCMATADEYERKAEEFRAHATAMRKLGAEVGRRKVAVVGDLPADVTRAMMTIKRGGAAVERAKKRATARSGKVTV